MGWLNKLCRNTGLMIHNAVDPYDEKKNRKVVSKKIESKQISPSVTLRKTTIEEVQVKNIQNCKHQHSEPDNNSHSESDKK